MFEPAREGSKRQSLTLACMGLFLSRGCRKGPIHFLVRQFLCSTWQPFLHPDLHIRIVGARRSGQGWAR
jgi:hypothetical protein